MTDNNNSADGPKDSSPELAAMTLASQRTVTADAPATRDVVAEPKITEAKSQSRLVRERFFRHKGAMGGMIGLALIVVLAFSSIGFNIGPLHIPGWWKHSFTDVMPTVEGGKPTLSWTGLGEHPFGQDALGRDYFAMTMRGAQISLIIAFIVGIVGTIVGTVIGALAGYYRGKVEAVLMRFTDVIITIPLLVVAAVLATIVAKAGIVVFAIFLGMLTWTGLARIVRGEFLSLREKEFVEAAKSVGASSSRIIFKHILPNTVGVIIVSATLAISGAILLETALGFLGLGVQEPDTSLGKLINENRSAMTVRPWVFLWPGVFIVAIALTVNFIGDGLRDAFDPRQTRNKQ
ncbi:ABC transporter permease [Arthrobacter sp. zg-Y411]|uniref:ABC transporter permease n=1 Tax=Arthrobacter TaxID=1663 RepID=UPI001D146CEE|nr:MULTISPECIES: ABC transporter permease [Arthrobacter]MCC3294769.1 ABC transporter permease [Arthrobacter zhangbolii]MDN3904036.1 ABC transporter permease [Arthrobacter sp. YD2]